MTTSQPLKIFVITLYERSWSRSSFLLGQPSRKIAGAITLTYRGIHARRLWPDPKIAHVQQVLGTTVEVSLEGMNISIEPVEPAVGVSGDQE